MSESAQRRFAPTPEHVARSYPPPKVPLFPVLSAGSFFGGKRPAIPSVLDIGGALSITSARMGIGVAMTHMGLRPGEKVLISAYHCNSMVEPVIWAGGEPVFYKINEDTSVDVDDVLSKIDERTRALMVTHYFGFPQDIGALRELCDKHGLVLIEDCAHVIFGHQNGKPLGSFADYTVCSPMKFFPIFDGGWLISSRRTVEQLPQKALGVKFNLKAWANVLDRSLRFGRLPVLRPFYASLMFLRNLGRRKPSTAENSVFAEAPRQAVYNAGNYSSGQPGEFDPDWLEKRMSATSRWLIRCSSKARIVNRRRENYQILFDAFASVPGARPLLPELPIDVVPYVFPLLVDAPASVFPQLKREGVPISRFGEYLNEMFDYQSCPVAVKLSERVLQFPCHQELTREELNWIIDKVKQTLQAARTPKPEAAAALA